MVKKTLSLKHEFDESEINEIAKTLADSLVHKVEAENNKKSITRQSNGEIKYWERQVEQQRNLITDGYEYRDVACEVTFNDPIAGQKKVTRLDTQDSWAEPMTMDEFDLFNNANVPTEEEE